MSWGINSYPPKETEIDTMHKLIKPQNVCSSTVSSSTSISNINNIPGLAATLNDNNNNPSRNLSTHPELPIYGQQDYVSSSNKLNSSLERPSVRYSTVNKHEFLPNIVSDSVSPHSNVSNEQHSNSFYQHHPLELPSPSSSTSSQASRTNNPPNVSSSVPTIFGSYSPSPFSVSFESKILFQFEKNC